MKSAWANVWTIAKRELTGYFDSPVAYVFIVIFLLLAGFFTFTFGAFFERGEASLGAFFTLACRGYSCSWCRRSACGCGRRSGAAARSSCC